MPSVTRAEAPAVDGGLRARKKRAVRAAIVAAALELFSDRGFDHTTVADIAARAEVSPATVARYFESKESLLFSERDERITKLQRAIAARPRAEGPYAAVLAALVELPWVEGRSDTQLLRSRRAILRSPTLRGRSSERLAGWRTGIAEALAERAVPEAEARIVATVAVALLDDATERWALAGGSGSLIDIVTADFDALERSWAPPARSAGRARERT
jgi:AcrR family transcriptional regulator